ncbi:lytic transglycosylase [Pantoea septica]|uniref:lytic transglycosylase n=1 Tax=Pantoea septica TaxID=472695 RepID=UPI00289BDC2B|nr:lytic transglycosylase [Pantoea septica]
MSAETIKDFLVSLGFNIDEAGARKFGAVLASTTTQAVRAGAAIEAAALSVVAYTAKVASSLDNLYWMSQRTGATVNGIKQIGYAVGQMGGSVDAARSSIENLARFVRNNPSAEGFLNRLGVQTRDAGGKARDMAGIFTSVGQRLSSMPYYRANQYAQMLGIDENTLMAMRRGLGQFSAQYSEMTKAIGFNADQAAASSNRFMTSLKAFGEMAGMARDKIGSNLAEGLAGSIDTLRKRILDNFPRIEQTITTGIKGILWLADAIGRVVFRLIQAGGDLIEWWKHLDSGTKNLIATFGALLVAWRVLNSAFLASPIGIILSLAGALVLLYDDYKTWKEGGKSLIDWGKWEPDIKLAVENIEGMVDSIKKLAREAAKLFGIDPKAWSLKWEFSDLMRNLGDLGKMLSLIGDLLSAVNERRWSDAVSIGKQLLAQGSERPDALPGVTKSAQETRSAAIDWYETSNAQLNRFLPTWLGGSSGSQAVEGTPDAALDIPGNLRRGERNNNPGNLNFAGQRGAALERPGGRFARFESAFDGLRALSRQLMLYAGRGINSVEKIISTWAPASDGNNTAAYIKAVAGRLGVNPHAALNMSDPQTMSMLMSSIITHENGRNIYSRDLISKAAVAGIGGNAAQISQQNTYHIYGGGDARQVGSEVERRQLSANTRAMRGNQTRVG